ncbi:unnamed protein product [Didymodactylos carnosus]|uniref:Xylose isomerase-like TIM barrel domain-containing protein n=1 Tax=Didymodactylos carnosus TaxID=1234261 RepID=A0A814CK45_9BILA|nr:unnamed protein product [Didymodactylos carnosus]CAF0944428.1 unnamed protein product [Didymodactylos carnosus]CAF3669242.1 unnamed protein product [Didymodactylos carnosus]CAF3720696.1 unnamed protein product [Didymodactylos carnosus]
MIAHCPGCGYSIMWRQSVYSHVASSAACLLIIFKSNQLNIHFCYVINKFCLLEMPNGKKSNKRRHEQISEPEKQTVLKQTKRVVTKTFTSQIDLAQENDSFKENDSDCCCSSSEKKVDFVQLEMKLVVQKFGPLSKAKALKLVTPYFNDPGQDKIIKSNMFIGAHVSVKGGVDNAIENIQKLNGRAVAMFLRSQRQWNAKPLTDAVATNFRTLCEKYNFKSHQILPHGIYLMNCGSPDAKLRKQSADCLLSDFQRCEKLGITMLNFHPGSSTGKTPIDSSIKHIAEAVNLVLSKTKGVTAVLENMCRQGYTIGGDFHELRSIIDLVDDKSRVGVCLDTCHAFAAGYDLSNEDGYNSMMNEFESIIGIKYLKGLHLNDSKGECNSHLDRHEHIGFGHIGLDGFRRIMNDKRFCNIPMVLETPPDDGVLYENEIRLLYNLIE